MTYISSNGYTFCFDMRPEAYDIPCLGLFCPRWEEGLQERMQEWLSQRLAGELAVPGLARIATLAAAKCV